MKKLSLILICLLLAMVVFTACGSNNQPASNEKAGSTENLLSKSFADIFNSGKYYMKYKMTAGTDTEGSFTAIMEIYIKGDMIANVTELPDQKLENIIRDGKMYVIMHDQKMIITMPDIPSNMQQHDGVVNTKGMVYKGTGKAEFAGRELTYEEYKHATTDTSMRYFFDEKTLAGIQIVGEGGTKAELEILELSGNVPDSVFELPTGYTVAGPTN